MTPAAQVAAAIEILDLIADGQPAEQVLTRWGRSNRFAGSKDRAAIRDHVFDVLRCWRSVAALGDGETGRARMIGKCRKDGIDPAVYFTGQGHAPAPLTTAEAAGPGSEPSGAVALDLSDWLLPLSEASLGKTGAEAFARASQARAPVTLRVNLARSAPPAARAALAAEGIETAPNPRSAVALSVTEGARKLRNSAAYRDGLVELQDASSQAVVEALPEAARALDYCAGGGGKALALAARGSAEVFAHDIDPARMVDLPARAARAGARIERLTTDALSAQAPFDVVLADAPCSGSGAWRRAPEGKWKLTPQRLEELGRLQDTILEAAHRLVAPGGTLAYATCSVLREENEDRVAAFLAAHPDWSCRFEKRFDVDDDGDGFFTAHLVRKGGS